MQKDTLKQSVKRPESEASVDQAEKDLWTVKQTLTLSDAICSGEKRHLNKVVSFVSINYSRWSS